MVIGSAGQVGSRVVRLGKEKGHHVLGGYLSRPPCEAIDAFQIDKTIPGQVKDVLNRARPEVVVDTGALDNVDYCETHPEEAFAVNATGTGNVAGAAAGIGAKYIFISSDYVFDGRRGAYTESDPTSPLNVYGRSKLEGERLALRSGTNVSVLRPSVVYSWEPTIVSTSPSGKPLNFAMWLLKELKSGKSVRIVQDQVSSPTFADDLAMAILAVAGADATGVFHAAGRTPLSRYNFAKRIAEEFEIETELITPTSSSALSQSAKRPLNSSLVSDRLEGEAGYKMMEISDALEALRRQSNSGASGSRSV